MIVCIGNNSQAMNFANYDLGVVESEMIKQSSPD